MTWQVFDTAPHYGLGLSEERLGRALAQLSAFARLSPGKLHIWTKVAAASAPPIPGVDEGNGGCHVRR